MSNPYIVYSCTHRGLDILCPKDGNHSEILDRSLLVMNAALIRFCRAYLVRMDLKFPDDEPYHPDNDLIRLFMEEFRVERMSAGHDFFYIWVWEQDTSINHHYHCCFVFNGNRTQNIYGHVTAARRIWGRLLGIPPEAAPIWDCTKDKDGNPQQNGIMIDINAPHYETEYARSYKWLSYLAKVSTKEDIPDGQRKFASSMIFLPYWSYDMPRMGRLNYRSRPGEIPCDVVKEPVIP
jgi:hypothetical protein